MHSYKDRKEEKEEGGKEGERDRRKEGQGRWERNFLPMIRFTEIGHSIKITTNRYSGGLLWVQGESALQSKALSQNKQLHRLWLLYQRHWFTLTLNAQLQIMLIHDLIKWSEIGSISDIILKLVSVCTCLSKLQYTIYSWHTVKRHVEDIRICNICYCLFLSSYSK